MEDTAKALGRAAGLRNIVAHVYAVADPLLVWTAATSGLADLEQFAAEIAAWLAAGRTGHSWPLTAFPIALQPLRLDRLPAMGSLAVDIGKPCRSSRLPRFGCSSHLLLIPKARNPAHVRESIQDLMRKLGHALP
jgi:hypothetical protein